MSRETRERGIKGKKIELGQKKLTMEEGKQGKKVSFNEQAETSKDRESLIAIKNEVRSIAVEFREFKEEIRQELENMKVGKEKWDKKITELESKFVGLEKEVVEIGEVMRREESVGEPVEETEDGVSERSVTAGSRRSRNRSRYSIASTRYSSDSCSGAFSVREVGKLKRWMEVKEKEERRNNIVIRGIKIEERENLQKGWIENMIKEKLDLDVKVTKSWASGTVIIGSLENEEMKKEVMRSKNKLRGERIFIENDLTWEERSVQREIARWVKEEKEKGRSIQIGTGRVKINGIWKKWEEVDKGNARKKAAKEVDELEN